MIHLVLGVLGFFVGGIAAGWFIYSNVSNDPDTDNRGMALPFALAAFLAGGVILGIIGAIL